VAAPLIYDIQALGVEKTTADLEGISHRMTDAEPAFVEAARILERGEQRLFKRLHGKYVRTGATRDSLTQPAANHAIREAHADELVFGTSIWYARFLRNKRGKSAVLVLTPTERKQINRTILDYITGE
jgi:hypothetical protein